MQTQQMHMNHMLPIDQSFNNVTYTLNANWNKLDLLGFIHSSYTAADLVLNAGILLGLKSSNPFFKIQN